MMGKNLRLPPFITIPICVVEMGLSMTTMIVYGFLLRRYNLSAMNNQVDDQGRVYIVYPSSKLAGELKKDRTTIERSMRELKEKKLIHCICHGYRQANMIYLNLPEQFEDTCKNAQDTGINASYESKNAGIYDAETHQNMTQKCSTNNIYNNRNNNNYNHPNQNKSYTNYKRKDAGRTSSMFAPIPDYENCDKGYGI